MLDLFGDGFVMVIDILGYFYGYVNLFCQVVNLKYVYLGGDCCYDLCILVGDKGIVMYLDGRGGLRSVYVDIGVVVILFDRIRDFVESC